MAHKKKKKGSIKEFIANSPIYDRGLYGDIIDRGFKVKRKKIK